MCIRDRAEVLMPVERILRLILLQQLRRSGTALHGSQGIGLARQQKNLQFFCGAYRNKAQEQEGQQIGHLSYNCRNTTITAGIFQPVILCDGQIVGNWKRTAGRGNVTIQTTLWVNASNIGSQYILNESNAEQREAKAMEALRGHFRPERCV